MVSTPPKEKDIGFKQTLQVVVASYFIVVIILVMLFFVGCSVRVLTFNDSSQVERDNGLIDVSTPSQ